ncbi:MAG TPA: hypothetical protein VFF11_07595 [Candidatus Binatia bacterium]|nr:hypothetical protein [Candidatus Binatia bacterium]
MRKLQTILWSLAAAVVLVLAVYLMFATIMVTAAGANHGCLSGRQGQPAD